MDITTTLNEITALSVEERIRLVQAIWDGSISLLKKVARKGPMPQRAGFRLRLRLGTCFVCVAAPLGVRRLRAKLKCSLWDSIAADRGYPDLTEAQRQELDRRIADDEANPNNVLTWEEIKGAIEIPSRIPPRTIAILNRI